MKEIKPKIIVSILVAIIFFVDITIPPGTALAILYAVPMALTFNQSKKTIIFFAGLCCTLTIFDDIVYYDPNLEFTIFVDGFLAIIGIILSSFAVVKYKALKEKNENRRKANLKGTLEMLFMISHRLRQPICSIKGLDTVLCNNEPTVKELNEIFAYLKDSIEKLDIYSLELTNFLDAIRKQQEMNND